MSAQKAKSVEVVKEQEVRVNFTCPDCGHKQNTSMFEGTSKDVPRSRCRTILRVTS